MRTKISRVIAVLLCVLMLAGSLPTTVFAAGNNFANAQLSVVTNKESTLATGVTQNAYTVYDKDGKQVKMFVTTADMSVDTVELFASYKDMDPTDYGMSKLTEQVAAFDEKAAAGDEYYQGTVVAGINASYYNMSTGKPTGTFVMNGIDVTTESEGNKYGYFAVMKDGSVKIGKPGDYSSDKGNIQEAIGIYNMLIVDGEIVDGLNSVTKYPRQTIGITADNQVILMTADGNQAPTTVGLTILEQAQVMLDLGCVWAGHLDGGGSCTYASKPEGSDSFVITNSPSDGSERSVSNGFIIVSTEAASKAFNRVMFTVENEYVTPGTSIPVATNGVSSTGNSAEIPAEVTYETTNGTFADGVFIAGDEVGEATITAMYNNEPVGTTVINVVVPDKISFDSDNITVPYGKTVELEMTANYGLNEVVMKTDDVTFELADTFIGKIDGLNFTAAEEGVSVTSSVVTAKLVKNAEITATTTVTLGKGSDIIFDFEDGTDGGFYLSDTSYNYVWPEGDVEVITAENGKVHSGDNALALNINYSNSLESGYQRKCLYTTDGWRMQNATRLGMWMYIPDEAVGLWARWQFTPVTGYDENGNPTTYGTTVTGEVVDGTITGKVGYVTTFEESGWHYISIDLTSYPDAAVKANWPVMQFYISDRDNSNFDYDASDYHSIPNDLVFYIDDITVDYSSAIDDRDAPVFESITYADSSMSDAVVLDGQTVTAGNKVSFGATVHENTSSSNYTGLDTATAKAYIDGVEVPCTINGNTMSIADVEFTDGQHHVKFSICDNQGNYASIIRTVNISAGNGTPIKVVPHDDTLDRILLGSVYYVDVVAENIETVNSVETIIDLNNISKWELDHMVVADGFTATYSIQEDENIATLNITRTGDVKETGEAALVSMPIRTWELKTGYTYENGTKAGQQALTYKQYRDGKEFWNMPINLEIDMGKVTFIDNTSTTFSGENVYVETEMWATYPDMTATEEGKAYYNAWNGGHIHTVSAVEDKAATCTENGYTGRTFCEECNSVVDWGTTVEATGHTYEIIDDVLKCACGDLFNGVYEDGKTYVDGVVLSDVWNGDSYYVDGKMLTGVQLVDDYYYDFGENGVCAGQTKYTGLFYDESVQAYRFSKLGVLTGGWQQIDDNWHYFKSYTKVAATGEYVQNGVTYQFDETGMTKGAWHTTDDGTRFYYGPSYYVAREPGYQTLVVIDGKTYNFDNDGYLTTGIQVLRDSTSFKKYAYEFGEDGAMIRQISEYGLLETSDGTYYINEDGYVPMDAGIVEYNDAYYYVVHSGKIKINNVQTITEDKANGLIEPGTYFFGEDGKIVLEDEIKNGIYNENGNYYYYVDGVMQKDTGLIQVDDAYYYVCYSGKLKMNNKQTVTEAKANGLIEAGIYFFGEDCKMVM